MHISRGSRNAMCIDVELQMLKTYVTRGLPQNKDDLKPTLGRYWPIRHDLAIIEGLVMKGKWIFIPFSLQKGDTRPTTQWSHGEQRYLSLQGSQYTGSTWMLI